MRPQYAIRFFPVAAVAALAAGIFTVCSCMGPDDGPHGGSDSGIILKAKTRLLSSYAKGSSAKPAAKKSAGPQEQRCDMGHPCVTPDNLEGRVHSGNFMAGGNGGAPGYPVRFLEGYDTTYRGENSDRGGQVTFNLGATTELGGFYACCDESHYPSDDLALVKRLEFTFDYLDVTFTVPPASASQLAGKTYTIRTVYVDSGFVHDLAGGDSVVLQGDKLLRAEGEDVFSWCTEAKCHETARPTHPLQADWMENTKDMMGYEHYAEVAVVLKKPMTFTLAEAKQGNWLFTADFDLTRGAVFAADDFAKLNTEAELVEAFYMTARDGGPGAIMSTVSLTKTQIDTTAN
jgi:hypothetical protein